MRKLILGRADALSVPFELALALSILLCSCVPPVMPSEIELETFRFKPLYEAAHSAAMDWSEDAYMVRASLPIWVRGETPRGAISFSFRSTSVRSAWLSVHVRSGGKGQLATESEVGQYEGQRPPANPVDLPDSIISSQEALDLASTDEVLQFFEENSDSILPVFVLEYSDDYLEEQPMLWSAYLSSASKMRFLTVQINAYSGEMVRSFDPSDPADPP